MEAESEGVQKSDKTSGKKPRRRMKATFTKIREQMEFYFSDSNLHKDRFLKKSIDETSDGYIALDVFLTFNKIKRLTGKVEVVADALHQKSNFLQLNPEKTHVKRVTPYKEPENVDERTVYVECIPHHADHEWVKKLFSACGKVAYISLPRYPSTGDPKGFGFVEFETLEGAQAACQELNNPPADFSHKAGMFPKSSHQMDAIRKKLPEEQVKQTEEKAKDLISTGNEEHVNTVGEPETVEDSEKTKDKETKSNKRRRTNSGSDSAANADSSPTKRRKSDVTFEVPSDDSKLTDDKTAGGKKKSRKRKSRSKTVDSEESKGESDLDKSGDIIPEKKQKLDEKSVNGVHEKTERKTENSAKESEQRNKENTSHKRKRFRRKKDKKEKEFPELRVLPKKEWLELRDEYLKLQKTSMALLKKTLGEYTDHSKKDDVKKSERKEIEFKPDVVVKVSSDNPMKRKNLKTGLGEGYKIAYIDVKDDQTEGYIRCELAESAKQICAATVPGYTFSAVTGEEEKIYWDKLKLDRETKFNTKCRHKKRGHEKWTEKAQKASIENVDKRHIIFEDE
ncbi:la-related protein 7-like isoform X2 [Mercenaria mercenaria]|nr:la-related protein 7-like isoform X2 [Mercenaria mercenaria]XP_053388181.1 la-related protein 7-like isoform X2 [Mercenaria mercenaria]